MSADAPKELKGWPESWYVPGSRDGQLRCVARGCTKVFKTAKEMEQRLEHYSFPQNEDIDFDHRILAAMCGLTKCPTCKYPLEGTTDTDIRPIFMHELLVHHTEEWPDIKKFIGLIRKNRKDNFPFYNFDKALELWGELYKYYRRNIVKQPEFPRFQVYLTSYKVNMKTDFLRAITHTNGDFPEATEEQIEECRTVYPVHRDAFLGVMKPRNEQEAVIYNIMKDRYRDSEF